jgi:hypothetical protein
MDYPDSCIRGIEKASYVVKGTDYIYATAELYNFRRTGRQDGMCEASINWFDGMKAIDFTFRQRNNDETLRYEVGIAILKRSELYRIRRRYGLTQFNYERACIIQDNKYHGNLLLNTANSTISKLIRGVLADRSEIHFRQEYSDLQPASFFSKLVSLFKAIATKVFREKTL